MAITTSRGLLTILLLVLAGASIALVRLTREDAIAAPAPTQDIVSVQVPQVAAARPHTTRSSTPAAPPALPEAPAPAAAAPSTDAPRDPAAALIERVRASAASSAPWTEHARQVIDGWRSSANKLSSKIELGAVECHRDGCIAVSTYPDSATFERADDSLTASEAFLAFPGWRHRTYRTQSSGQIVATWLFMNPESAE